MNKIYFILFALISVVVSPVAQAGEVDGVVATYGDLDPGTTITFNNDAVNNDNANSTTINPVDIAILIGSVAPIDVVLGVNNSGGTTEYAGSANITNNTGTPWIGFEIFLGFGQQNDANFQASMPSDFVDFDAGERDPTPTSNIFPTLNHGANILTWADAIVNPGNLLAFTFNFDLPDYNGFIPLFAQTVTGYNLTIRFNPIADPSFTGSVIPEPGTFALLGLGLLGFLAARRKLV